MKWPEVLRALSGDGARNLAIGRYRVAGFTGDDFARSRLAREAMTDALTRAEDWLEYEGPRSPDRSAIQAVRRRLEWELWP